MTKPKSPVDETGHDVNGRVSGNPARFPGVVVYEPEFDHRLQYDPDTRGVVDPASGDKFWRRPAHGDNIGYFGLSSDKNVPIIQGAFYIHVATEADGQRAIVFEVARNLSRAAGEQGRDGRSIRCRQIGQLLPSPS